jgi:phytoene dehydrogenase-like protein
MEPFAIRWDDLAEDILGSFPFPPKHPFLTGRFGLKAFRSARGLVEDLFSGPQARAVFAGMAAHSFLRLEQSPSASFGLVLGILAHALGWPIPRGGSQKIIEAMAGFLTSLGGQIQTGREVELIDELPTARAVLFDLTPKQVVRIAGHRLPDGYRRALMSYRYGPGIFKIDWALSGPIPWKNPDLTRAGTVHLGPTLDDIAQSENAIWQGKDNESPFVLLAQQSLFDPTRAPKDKHTGWAYCHVPSGSTTDMTEPIIRQIERFAPGFRDLILDQHTFTATGINAYNANYVGGDINGGVQDLDQLFTRPVWRFNPYTTPTKGIYLCSSSTPPGGGVHGMCGYHAARTVLGHFS